MRISRITITGTFYDEDGALADPTSATVYVQHPSGSESTYSASSATTGIWTYDLELATDAAPGVYYYGVRGTGALAAYDEQSFRVKVSKIFEE